ncbi:outer membrane protein [Hyphomicrobium sulfonivorans]|uniref:outer membrane protein n=1 Tax=Hyphomicrobium sulfonivorans TaxID=121290 RepID=UPI00156F52C9|nr:outer membrane beta-barrel protein [Hyphomicrobium sulfonivorans]MBI1651035.1 porin family protein [Hyphomicrobium sulfonivorans]NSL72582.1 hypothetical protein [Hyphomicrobium sulfonivorans]
MSVFKRLSRGVVACVLPVSFATAVAAGPFNSYQSYSPRDAWSGLYLGVHEAGAWGDSDWTFANGSRTSPDYTLGALFGGQIGYQQQWDNFVLGAELSYSGALNVDQADFCPGGASVCGNELNGLLLANARLGYAFGRTLLYGTAGYARANIKADIDAGGGPLDLRGKEKISGWNYGGGFEYLITPSISFGLEYIRVDLRDKQFALSDGAGVVGEVVDIENTFNVVRGRISVKLGGGDSGYASPLK